MTKWIEVTNIMEPAQDGDLFLSARANPAKVTIPLVVISPMEDVEDNRKRFQKQGLKFQQDDWPDKYMARKIIHYIKMRCGLSFAVKIRVWRKYVPRTLPINEIYSQPLPLP